MAELWIPIEPYLLFNKLNNMEPMLVLDARERSEFEEIHLKRSYHVDVGKVLDLLQDIVNRKLTQSVVKNIKSIVLICNGEMDDHLMNEINDSLRKVIVREETPLQLCRVSSSDFWNRYRDCDFLVNSASFSEETKKKLKFRSQYYATEIIPNFLFLGDYQNGSEISQLKSLGISHIIDATNEHYSEETARELSINYLPIDIWDIENADISQHFETTNQFIQSARENNGKVIVHCRAGWSRSPSIALAYLLYSKFSTSLKEAIAYTVTQRPFVCPNTGFRDQLRKYELMMLGESSFNHDNEFVHVIHSNSKCWSGATNSESDFDRISINAVKKTKFNIEEFSPNATSSSQPPQTKPKKPFLKRGSRTIVKNQ